MTMRRFLLKREVAAISDWEFGKNKRKRKKGVWLCIVEAPCWMDRCLKKTWKIRRFSIALALALALTSYPTLATYIQVRYCTSEVVTVQ